MANNQNEIIWWMVAFVLIAAIAGIMFLVMRKKNENCYQCDSNKCTLAKNKTPCSASQYTDSNCKSSCGTTPTEFCYACDGETCTKQTNTPPCKSGQFFDDKCGAGCKKTPPPSEIVNCNETPYPAECPQDFQNATHGLLGSCGSAPTITEPKNVSCANLTWDPKTFTVKGECNDANQKCNATSLSQDCKDPDGWNNCAGAIKCGKC